MFNSVGKVVVSNAEAMRVLSDVVDNGLKGTIFDFLGLSAKDFRVKDISELFGGISLFFGASIRDDSFVSGVIIGYSALQGDWNLLRGSNSVEIWLAIDLIGGSDWELDTFYEDGHVKVSLGIELGKQSHAVLFRDSIDGVLGYYN